MQEKVFYQLCQEYISTLMDEPTNKCCREVNRVLEKIIDNIPIDPPYDIEELEIPIKSVIFSNLIKLIIDLGNKCLFKGLP